MSAVGWYFCLKNLSIIKELNFSLKYSGSCHIITGVSRVSNLSTSILRCREKNENASDKSTNKTKVFIREDGTKVKKLSPTGPKILAVGIDGSRTAMYMESAEKLAKRNNWVLQKIEDKHKKEIYQFKSKTLSTESNQKDHKKILLNSQISLHDLEIKIKSIFKLLQKGKHVRISIEGTNDTEEHTKKTSELVKEKLGAKCKINNLKISRSHVIFVVRPIVEENEHIENSAIKTQ